jgi:2-iminobutanoate/2-iminopropanoate deaminase
MTKPVGPYTPVVEAGEWVVVSGQVGLVEGKLVEGGFDGQCNQALVNLRTQLESVGASLADVVEAFGDHRPARSAVGVAELPLGALVEVEAWARRVGG